MRTWREVRAAYGLRTEVEPVIREIKGKTIIFWFRNGNGAVADVVVALKKKGANVTVIWDEGEGLTGIALQQKN